ncbi:Cation/H(+) antiporter 15 [Quillaja saponaria]|uniref:Cation/H(+) antiporter 15 n=1 Tax=Quillaja saponaria TaxID=32244 RepID=A0AAD7LKZ9_QUISA|nr:Cation/H(+) antiporter 15 [Quillaja saponaria]
MYATGQLWQSKFTAEITTENSIGASIGSFVSAALLILFIMFGVHPAALWAIGRTPEGKPVKEIYIFAAFLTLLVCGFIGEIIGLNAFVASFFVGLAIPDGPPLGAALVDKLDCFVSVLLMPILFTIAGLKMDVFAIQKLKNVAVIQLIIFVSFFGKVIGTVLPSLFCRMRFRDALSLGLIMNSKGIVELIMLIGWKVQDVMNEECYSIMVISLVIITGVVSPIVKVLYDPSSRFLAYKRRTILHHRNDEELRILACIHSQDNVHLILKLLAASNPTKESAINLVALHLVKLAGQASSQLVAYLPRDKPSQFPTRSERIFNAFIKFEQHHRGQVILHCYKGISPYATMHNDVCSLALEKRTTLIIIHFISSG